MIGTKGYEKHLIGRICSLVIVWTAVAPACFIAFGTEKEPIFATVPRPERAMGGLRRVFPFH